jgi:hypothetical protein
MENATVDSAGDLVSKLRRSLGNDLNCNFMSHQKVVSKACKKDFYSIIYY